MAKITLAKALKWKNRLAAKIEQLTGDISRYNSVLAGNPREADVAETWERREQVVAKLVELKTAISHANAPVQTTIYELAEAKGAIGFLRSIDTTHGRKPRQGFYDTEAVEEYEAALRKQDVDELIAAKQRCINELQDLLEEHNHRTKIDIDVPEEFLA